MVPLHSKPQTVAAYQITGLWHDAILMWFRTDCHILTSQYHPTLLGGQYIDNDRRKP